MHIKMTIIWKWLQLGFSPLTVVTFYIALLKAVCSPLKKFLAVNKLVTGNEATVPLVKRDWKFAMFWPPDQESVPIMPAYFSMPGAPIIVLASIIYQGLSMKPMDMYSTDFATLYVNICSMCEVYQQSCTSHMSIPNISWVVKASVDTICS